MIKLTILLILCLSGCLPNYKADIAFISSGYAEAPRYLVQVDSISCINARGKVGSCSLDIAENKALVFSILPQAYDYTINFRCSYVDINLNVILFHKYEKLVLKGTDYSEKISPEEFKDTTIFSCRGRITRTEAPVETTAIFDFRINVFSKDYKDPSEIYESVVDGKKMLILGENAKYIKVLKSGKWSYFAEKTGVDIVDPDFAMYETEKARFNYYWRK